MSEITSVQIDNFCNESYPCKHSIIIHRGLSIEKSFENGRSIARDYWNFLTEEWKKHFEEYLEKNRPKKETDEEWIKRNYG
jgi:hypothetical protein